MSTDAPEPESTEPDPTAVTGSPSEEEILLRRFAERTADGIMIEIERRIGAPLLDHERAFARDTAGVVVQGMVAAGVIVQGPEFIKMREASDG